MPELSQGGVYHTTASGKKLLPVITTVALKKSSGLLLGFHVVFPASTEVIDAGELSTTSGTTIEGVGLGFGFATLFEGAGLGFGLATLFEGAGLGLGLTTAS